MATAGAHIAKAQRLLEQARSMDPQESPEALAHLSYYAMFHAATALLLHAGNTAPKTHRGLIGLFGRLLQDLDPTAREHGKALNRAADLRLLADYDPGAKDLDQAAAACRADAEPLVFYCARRLADPDR